MRDSGELELLPDNSDAIRTLRVILSVRCVVFAHRLVIDKTHLSMTLPVTVSVVVIRRFTGHCHLREDVKVSEGEGST